MHSGNNPVKKRKKMDKPGGKPAVKALFHILVPGGNNQGNQGKKSQV